MCHTMISLDAWIIVAMWLIFMLLVTPLRRCFEFLVLVVPSTYFYFCHVYLSCIQFFYFIVSLFSSIILYRLKRKTDPLLRIVPPAKEFQYFYDMCGFFPGDGMDFCAPGSMFLLPPPWNLVSIWKIFDVGFHLLITGFQDEMLKKNGLKYQILMMLVRW